MLRFARVAPLAAVAFAASCGGDPFSLATGGEAGAIDAAVESSGDHGADAGDAAGGAIDAQTSDAPYASDVVTQPPPHCGGGFACAPSVPPGWSGPLELYAGSSAPPSCSAHFSGPSYDGNAVLSAPPANCTCDCSIPPGGVQCSSPTLSFYQGFSGTVSCTAGSHCADIILKPDACTTIDIRSKCPGGQAVVNSFSAPASIVSEASCSHTASTNLPVVSWGVNARACVSSVVPAPADCAAGLVCAPQPSREFEAALCIAQPGNVSCPSTGYTAKHLYYGGVAEGRSCSPCTCGPVDGATCSASIDVYPSANLTCSGSEVADPTPFTCDTVQQPGDFKLTVTAAGGSCTPSPVSATGTATPSLPTTLCCLP